MLSLAVIKTEVAETGEDVSLVGKAKEEYKSSKDGIHHTLTFLSLTT